MPARLQLKLSDPMWRFVQHKAATWGMSLSDVLRVYIVNDPEFQTFVADRPPSRSANGGETTVENNRNGVVFVRRHAPAEREQSEKSDPSAE